MSGSLPKSRTLDIAEINDWCDIILGHINEMDDKTKRSRSVSKSTSMQLHTARKAITWFKVEYAHENYWNETNRCDK